MVPVGKGPGLYVYVIPWLGSVSMMGGGMILLVIATTVEVDDVMMTLDTSITEVVTGGMVMMTMIVEVMYVTTPLVVSGQVSKIVSVTRGKSMVVRVESVQGGRTSVHGGSQLAVGVAELQMMGSMDITAPPPSPSPLPLPSPPPLSPVPSSFGEV